MDNHTASLDDHGAKIDNAVGYTHKGKISTSITTCEKKPFSRTRRFQVSSWDDGFHFHSIENMF